MFLGRDVPMFLPFNSSGADEKFPCTFSRGQGQSVSPCHGPWVHPEGGMGVPWREAAFGVIEGIHASADLGTL